MRTRGIFLNFLAQLVYHHAKILRLLCVIGSPDNLQQSPMGQRLSLLNYERAQDVEFFRTQVDSVTADIDDSLLKVNAQFRSLDFGEGLIGGGPSHCRPDACQQFADSEGFYDIVIRPRIERENLILLRVSDGDHDNRPTERQSNFAADLESAHARHIYIQENQVWTVPNDCRDRLFAILCLDYLIAITGERYAQDPTNLRFVVDHENGCIVHWSCTVCTWTKTSSAVPVML